MQLRRIAILALAAMTATIAMTPVVAHAKGDSSEEAWVEKPFSGTGAFITWVNISCPASHPHYTGTYKIKKTKEKPIRSESHFDIVQVHGEGTDYSPHVVKFPLEGLPKNPFKGKRPKHWAGKLSIKCT